MAPRYTDPAGDDRVAGDADRTYGRRAGNTGPLEIVDQCVQNVMRVNARAAQELRLFRNKLRASQRGVRTPSAINSAAEPAFQTECTGARRQLRANRGNLGDGRDYGCASSMPA